MTARRLFPGVLATGAVLVTWPGTAQAYVGPGAGFAFVSSFFILFVTFLLATFTLLTWPARALFRALRGRRAVGRGRARRVVVLGLDGQDPALTRRFMEEGRLPHLARLAATGTFGELQTTLLAESPVAWASFQTGCNPGKHRVYDFLVPNRKSHLPELSSARVEPSRRVLKLGRYRIPLGRPLIQVGRKSQPFWKVLGDHGVFSAVLRVPISFPPEPFAGVLLSAMGAPDLRGSQGTYFYFTTDPDERRELKNGVPCPLQRTDDGVAGELIGPDNFLRQGAGPLRAGFQLRPQRDGSAGILRLDGKDYWLPLGRHTPLLPVIFRPGLGLKVRGLCRFVLIEAHPQVRLYVTPIAIDPAHPALPISHPLTYSVYLARTLGPFSTLGLAEDTSALNEGVIDEAAFLEQCYLIHEERERMFFDALDKVRRGCVVCVFDITDRLQHMFFRYLEPDHPANRGRDVDRHRNAIAELYERMDDLVGRTLARLGPEDVLLVMSDHGFKPFRRAVNLNAWLWREGFLAVNGQAPTGADMFAEADWSRTRAYAVGFGGIYLNLAGRERHGIVQPGPEAESIQRAIAEGLLQLRDPVDGAEPVRRVYRRQEVYTGPYAADSPDLIVGFRPGYRVGWSSVTGGVVETVIEDNTRPWSGDHNFNPPDVPGLLSSNLSLAAESARIIDIAPTVLELLGVPRPAYLDGRSLVPAAVAPQAVPASEPATAGVREAAS